MVLKKRRFSFNENRLFYVASCVFYSKAKCKNTPLVPKKSIGSVH